MANEQQEPAAVLDPSVDPHPDWSQARRAGPVRVQEIFGMRSYALTRFAEVEQALRDGDTFSSRVNLDTMGPYMGEVILAKDGHAHTVYRNLVSRAFRASALQRWEQELISPTIHRLLDRIAPLGRAELVRDVTRAYPLRVIAGVMGVPLDDHDEFFRWAEDINCGPTDHERALAGSRAMRAYLEPIVEDRKRSPRDDLISDIVTAEIDGVRLDDEHIYGFLRLLLPAGAETTYRVMGNCLCALLTHPRDLERVRADRALVPEAVEETLRWETSVTMVQRETTREVEIGSTRIPKGTMVLMLTSSSNRDESRFERPDEWDLDRKDKHHLAFGWGRHVCLGMHLARAELRIGVNAILDRLPGLRLDPDAPSPRIQGLAFRGPDALPVLFD